MSQGSVDTRRVPERRHLRFGTFADALRDIDALVEAERAGTLRRLGNWTLGQALSHVAAWASYPHEGYPAGVRPGPLIRLIARRMKKRLLAGPLPAGLRLPKAPGGTWGVEDITAPAGAERCRRAFERLDREPPQIPNPALGVLTHEEWKRLNLAHAELHLSFFRAG
jgi:hypothetical protein